MYIVYHNPNSDFFHAKVEKYMDLFPVAIVPHATKSKAFELTNHIDQAWHDNDDVVIIEKSRSTSVGDVLATVEPGKGIVKAEIYAPCSFEDAPHLIPILKMKFKQAVRQDKVPYGYGLLDIGL